MRARARRAAPLSAFLALCYVPLLASSPERVLADTKAYLYLDPGRVLARADSMWDPHVGLGTVTHQNIGFVWPMGPYYWVMEQMGLPDWVAQRLWLGSIIALAGLGVRYLLRGFNWRGAGVAVAMVAYAFTPYLLSTGLRISAILLPYVALPWLLAFTVRSLRSGSWRHPALFALVVTTAGTSNATSILLVGVAPALWIGWELAGRELSTRRITLATARMAALTLATNIWWIAGLSVQATHGLDVLRYTESVGTTAAASSAQEVLRGLGNWFFYGDDALGPWVASSGPFQSDPRLILLTFAIPALALLGAALARWSERTFFIVLLVVGVVLAVGPHPFEAPSLVGRAIRAFVQSDIGLAMRSLPRAVPLVVLALAVMLGAGVQAAARARPSARVPLAAGVILLVLAALPPLWQRTWVPERQSRPEEIPDHWIQAARFLDDTADGTRVLEIPGADFATYRWGATLDPVTPGLTDRPVVARELVPMGSAPAANLLKAFDSRLQLGLTEPATVAPLARLMRAGDVLVRSDLRFEHFDTPRPRELWSQVEGAPGLGPAIGFGPARPNVAQQPNPMLDELRLTLDPNLPHPPPVAVLPVRDAAPIASLKPAAAPIVLAGDGDGIVDSAAAGVIDGHELIRYSAALSTPELDAALADDAVLVVTDTNRRRGERWGSIRYTSGYTEPAGQRPLRLDRSDARLPVFPSAGDDARTVALHQGGISAGATSYGGLNEYSPHLRPAQAVDGDASTAWRTGQDQPVVGERIEISLDRPVSIDRLGFLAPQEAVNRWVTRMEVRFDGGDPLELDLDLRSRSEPGQTIQVGRRTFSHLSITITGDSVGPRARYGGLTSTGFAELRIGDLRLDELVRPPVDLLSRAGSRSQDHPLAFVLTRLRTAPTSEPADEEVALARSLDLPTARSFGLSGSARVAARADDGVLASLLGEQGTIQATSSARIFGTTTRASLVLDGDPSTAWTTPFREVMGQSVTLERPGPAPLSRLDLQVVADGLHSIPARFRVEADGVDVGAIDVPPIVEGSEPGTVVAVPLTLPQPLQAGSVRLVIDEVRERRTPSWRVHELRTMPVAIAEVDWGGARLAPPTPRFASGCRDDLLTLDGAPVPVQVEGSRSAAVAGDPLALSACDGAPLSIAAGSHELRATDGRLSGLDLDRIVLRSAPGGGADLGTGTLRSAQPAAEPLRGSVSVLDAAEDSLRMQVTGGEGRTWIVLGQSFNSGWTATIDGRDLGAPQLVDGFANGWLVDATPASFEVELRFAPQRRVDVALWVSAAAALLCLVLAVRRPAAERAVTVSPPAPLTPATVQGPLRPPLELSTTLALSLLLGLTGLAVANPAVGLATALVTFASARELAPRWAVVLVAPLALAAGGLYVAAIVWRDRIAPGLEWVSELDRAHPLALLAILSLLADAVVHAARGRWRR